MPARDVAELRGPCVTIQTFDRARTRRSRRGGFIALLASVLTADLASSSPLRRSASFSGMQIAVLGCALLMLAAIPILTQPLPPIEDYVNHLARMHVIASVGSDPDRAAVVPSAWSFP